MQIYIYEKHTLLCIPFVNRHKCHVSKHVETPALIKQPHTQSQMYMPPPFLGIPHWTTGNKNI